MTDALKLYAWQRVFASQAGSESYITALVRAHRNALSPEARVQQFGARATAVQLVANIAESDLCLLPMTWNYYEKFGREAEAIRYAQEAEAAGKNVIVWVSGDFDPLIPITNAVQIGHGPHRSVKRPPRYIFALPQLFGDYAPIYFKEGVQPRPKAVKPVIGFCGQAQASPARLAHWIATSMLQQARFKLGTARIIPLPMQSPVELRGRILKHLAQSPLVTTQFIIRDRYRAGLRKSGDINDPQHPSRLEFVRNIYDSDYTVCVRGVGNFSQRLYETLCCGRIPIFVNTDCVLPYDFAVEWRQYCVWIELHEIPQIGEKVAEFHARLSDSQFADLQRACRQLWLDRLSVNGFYGHFPEHYEAVTRAASANSAP